MSIESINPANDDAKRETRSNKFLMGLIKALWVVSWVLMAVFVISFVVSLLALFGVETLKTQLFNDILPLSSMISSLTMIVGTAAFLVILKQLKKICQTLTKGDPFVPENANRLRIIWIAVAAAEILRLLSGVFLSWQHNKHVEQIDGDTVLTLDIRVYVWFLVLALVVLAEVFREGARLRQEQKLTI